MKHEIIQKNVNNSLNSAGHGNTFVMIFIFYKRFLQQLAVTRVSSESIGAVIKKKKCDIGGETDKKDTKIQQADIETYLVEALEFLDRVDRFLAASARLAHLLLLFLRFFVVFLLFPSLSVAVPRTYGSCGLSFFTKHCSNVKNTCKH